MQETTSNGIIFFLKNFVTFLRGTFLKNASRRLLLYQKTIANIFQVLHWSYCWLYNSNDDSDDGDVFEEWLTKEGKLVLFPFRTITVGSNHHKNPEIQWAGFRFAQNLPNVLPIKTDILWRRGTVELWQESSNKWISECIHCSFPFLWRKSEVESVTHKCSAEKLFRRILQNFKENINHVVLFWQNCCL